jgi:hypothetical protein
MTKKEKSMAKASKTTVQNEPVVPIKKSLFDRVAGYLDANDWHYNAESGKGYFSMGCRIKEASVRVIIDVFESDDWRRVMTFSIYPIFVSENRRPAVLEAINRMNHGLVYGNLEMDPADGEIRFRTSVESDVDIPESMMERVLNGNIAGADKHFSALMAVAFGGAAPDGVKEIVSRPDNTTLQ